MPTYSWVLQNKNLNGIWAQDFIQKFQPIALWGLFQYKDAVLTEYEFPLKWLDDDKSVYSL